MKKKSPPYAIIGAIVLGVIAAALIYSYLQGKEKEKQDALAAERKRADDAIAQAQAHQAPTVAVADTNVRPVLYATQPVEPGIRISAAFFEKKLTPKDILPDAYTEQSDIVGWYAIRKIEKGDPLTPRNIGKSLPYLSQRISPGMRSITLQVFGAPNLNLTGGFIVDGDRVDLLYTVLSSDGVYIINTQMIMQNLKILYVPGPTIKTDQTDGITPVGGPIGITFEVTPEQAEALVFLESVKNTNFSMIMRARKDDTQINIKPFVGTDYDLLNMKKVQKTVDKSMIRVNELAQQIEAKEKAASGKTNETPTPTPPSP